MNAARALLSGLIDYAGLFPPAKLDMEHALAEYQTLRAGPCAWMGGRFIVPASRLAEFDSHVEANSNFPLSVILDAGHDARSWFEQARQRIGFVTSRLSASGVTRAEVLEIPMPAPAAARETFDAPVGQLSALMRNAGLSDMPVYVELPRVALREERLPNAFAALARYGLRAKIRCGGASNLTPSTDELAQFILQAARHAVAFKATAGLHHALPYEEAPGEPNAHGFLNLLAASVFAWEAAAAELVPLILQERSWGAFVVTERELQWRDRAAALAQIENARRNGFVSYGSCSFQEPVGDLLALGLLPTDGAHALLG
ncbi:MAG: hypothetical protein DLM50_09020 [Candidatus Meridianibacter frigidus]|nr:MAG: hypothetical protein DLM50_09020 [Candidatus Eremiobacteraeota bacterium]